MNILTVEQLTKSFGDKVLFDQLSLTVAEQQRIGLIGINGTGKSTLLKVIAGIETADAGVIDHPRQFHIEYLPQNPEFREDSTVLEEVFFGDTPLMTLFRTYEQALAELEDDPTSEAKQNTLFSLQQKMDAQQAWDANTSAKIILTKLGIEDFSKRVYDLSGGQKKRVAIAKALIQQADLLILDEPTNHLDNQTIEWLEDYLSTYKGSLLTVTHDRYFLNRVANRIIELDQGRLYSYEGNYQVFLEKKAEREAREASMEQKRQNLLRKEIAWLKRGAKARTTKQKARIQRVEQLKAEEGPRQSEQVDVAIGSQRLGKKVIEINEVEKAIDGRTLIDQFSYLVLPNDRIGIIGPNGSGKTTLLNMIAGKVKPDSGEIDIGPTVKIGYYTQESQELDENLRVIEYIKEVAEVIYTKDGQAITAAQMLERFLFSRHAQWTKISKLSGGEKRRLYLLRILMSEPNVLFLDEPTNDLDTETLSVLEDYLEQFPGAVITVSHDRYFLDRSVDHLFAFEGNGSIRHFYGSYSDYIEEKKQQEKEASAQKKVSSEHEKVRVKETRQKKLSYKQKREWEDIQQQIELLEQRSEELKAEIENVGSDFEKANGLYEEQQKVDDELEQAIERWAELSELIEKLEQNESV
ncbi:ABC-F family ATP-binding cassette domain-containing protein [Desertibacillus haloalkaliphilus]|uniref:ABC-F family ATP-binding cassette domain-containing protein n=1 Tax=Desertibacillus haloalkaliphilus TaxID=1328930 RepID=UPI001C27941C|nr:ABC-F family ATP-binding cassette domain-containing protein [Desertibacillus haloalkaliphilus]MBU8907309.1 ABC-F family ATP-binding cassette domain-containing protein [Desertibacillus haloalkaliphilus]